MDDPRDSATFRMAVAGLGLGLVIAIAGICVILAFGTHDVERSGGHTAVLHDQHGGEADRHRQADTHRHSNTHSWTHSHSIARKVPPELWLIAAGLFGALIGLLLPTPRIKILPKKRSPPQTGDRAPVCRLRLPNFPGWVAFALAAGGIVFLLIADDLGTVEMDGALVACATALIGILIPSPVLYDPL